jgi:hypothetical protein
LSGHFWVFGGSGYSNNDPGSFLLFFSFTFFSIEIKPFDNTTASLMDLWMYDMEDNEWMWVSGSQEVNAIGKDTTLAKRKKKI